ncbi:MAG TPA: hypothetical protein VHZ97_01625 [Pseudonocardiaceae bacterium]|nr:hypothetical protein [Pseudonocardiaceae bacterium]
MRKYAAAVASVVALCALVGCSSPTAKVAPKPSPTTTASSSSDAAECWTADHLISACGRLGDLTTLDPCGLITVAALPADLKAAPTDRDSFDYCDFAITVGTDKDATLRIGELDVADVADISGGEEQLQPEGLDLAEGTLSNGECDDAVRFGGDEVAMDVDVFVSQGEGSQALCDAANEAGKAVGDVINSTVKFQHFIVPKNSLLGVKACEMLNGSKIGSDTLDSEADPSSGHFCQWRTDGTTGQYYTLRMTLAAKADGAAANGQTTIQGLSTFIFKSDDSGSQCELDTYRAPWAGSNLFETASVSVQRPPDEVDTACALATQMANLAWPQLPPIS